MKRERVKTNIVELSKLHTEPPLYWDNKFVNGKLDAHKVFTDGTHYEFLYKNSDYDLIGWEIENGVFDWESNSWAVARFCPEYFDAERYNWDEFSEYVAEYCPDKLDPKRYNWERASYAVAMFCPNKLDPERFDWKLAGWAVAVYCPDKLDPERFDWEYNIYYVKKYCPKKLKLRPKR